MHWKNKLLNLLSSTWLWLRSTPRLTEWAGGVAVLLLLICWGLGYHRLPSQVGAILSEDVEASLFVRGYDILRPYIRLGALLGSVVCMIHLGRVLPALRRMVTPMFAVFGYATLWAVLEELHSHWRAGSMGSMGEPFSPFFYGLKVLMLAAAIVSPPFMMVWYSRQKLLDRYTLKNFLQPLAFCLVAFLSLFILIDLIDNMRDFQEAKLSLGTITGFYLGLIPHIYVYPTLPAALMLSVLYALMKMSRANEIISMLTAGRSLGQILRPIFIVSAYASFLSMVANYHWGPRAEAMRGSLMMSDRKAASLAQTVTMYHHEPTHRTWFASTVPFDPTKDWLTRLDVHQLDEKGRIKSGWYSYRARWFSNGTWVLYNGMRVDYEKGVAVRQEPFPAVEGVGTRLSITDWLETPWTLISGALTADNLGVPDIASYLSANVDGRNEKLAAFRTHLMQRFALPWQALVLVLMAAPLGVSFSRRGALGGIAGSVFMFFGLMFLNNFFMNLGKADHLPPVLAVWMPHLIVGFFAIVFFRLRSANQDLPKWNHWPAWFLAQWTDIAQELRRLVRRH